MAITYIQNHNSLYPNILNSVRSFSVFSTYLLDNISKLISTYKLTLLPLLPTDTTLTVSFPYLFYFCHPTLEITNLLSQSSNSCCDLDPFPTAVLRHNTKYLHLNCHAFPSHRHFSLLDAFELLTTVHFSTNNRRTLLFRVALYGDDIMTTSLN